jgi:hypothetical protein
MRIDVEIDAGFLFESGFEFCLQILNKLTNPPVSFIIFLAIADKDG